MFKIDKKLIVSASAVVLLATGCVSDDKTSGSKNTSAPAKTTSSLPSIDGGVKYPVVNGKTGPYLVNEQSKGMKINHGRLATKNELAEWDVDVMPDGTGLPEGSGSVEDGEELYETSCVMCHGDFGSGGGGYPSLAKGNGEELQKTLTNNRWHDPEADGPVRVFGSYWPQASTLFWYIRDGMPHTRSKTLTTDQVYALTAYVLSLNEIQIEGEDLEDDYVLNREKFLKIKMPNKDGFEPNIDGPNALNGIRKYYENPKNFGGIKVKPSERCMSDCQEPTAEVTRIKNGGIKDFLPPMSVAKTLPEVKVDAAHKVTFDAKKAYEESCVMCHGTMAPAAGDKKAWASILEQGKEKVYENGLKGTQKGMPAKGGSSLSEEEFKKVVDFMTTFK